MNFLKPRWLLAIPLLLGASLAPASEIRDRAGMFGADAVRQATADLDRLEQATKVATLIETVDSLNGKTIGAASLERARTSGIKGVYVLIARKEHKLEVRDFKSFLGEPRRRSVVSAFTTGFKAGNLDDGLTQGVQAIEDAVAESGGLPAGAPAAVPPGPGRGRGGAVPGRVPVPANPGGGSSGLGILVVIGLVILAVLIGIRLLGSLFGGGRGYAGPPRMAGRGYGAPGYGGPGGRGGGFFSGLLGGLGGAVAGNWLYDQFGNRHHGGGPTDSGGFMGGGAAPPEGDWGGTSGDWGGGGDVGGGGDWGGGGGGDWGGGGGDGGDGGSW